MILYTIGYERRQPWEVLYLAKQAGVKILVDVRADQRSRKPGMDPDTLRVATGTRGMYYMPYPGLGVPFRARRHIREKNIPWDGVKNLYAVILREHSQELISLCANVAHMTVCLMCFERDPQLCHRSILAEKLQSMVPDLNVIHL